MVIVLIVLLFCFHDLLLYLKLSEPTTILLTIIYGMTINLIIEFYIYKLYFFLKER